VFKKEETNQRQSSEAFRVMQKMIRGSRTGTEGVIANLGKKWKEQRRFMLSTLRDFGFGKSSMEDMVNEEVGHFIQHLDDQSSDIISVQVGFSL
jgi:hypothetical protein